MPRTRGSSCCRFQVVACLLVMFASPEAEAQQRAITDSAYARAHRLVAQGRGDAGRAIVDSMLRVTSPGTANYAEGLFWRATTAKRAEDAERDYLRIVIEYPLSPRAEESLIRLAEMEMLRGDRTRAQRHLQRLIVEHPSGPWRAKASYWLARIFFEANEVTRGCHELNTARSRMAPADVELRNQVDYQSQRCVGLDSAPMVYSANAGASSASVPPSVPPSAPPSSPPAPTLPGPAAAGQAPTTSAGSTTGTRVPTEPVKSPTQPVTGPPPTQPQPATSGQTPASRHPVQPAGASAFTVQVAAFPTRDAALSFMETLRARGYDARIWGTQSPFRVRIGRFATRVEANVVAAELRAKMISKDAWVTEAEVR